MQREKRKAPDMVKPTTFFITIKYNTNIIRRKPNPQKTP